MQMPWVAWQARTATKERENATKEREKKHASARGRLSRALEERAEPVLRADAVEWSTSFDLPDWQDFAKYLTQKLQGDLLTAAGRAAITVIMTAPVDDEDSILLNTRLGAIRLGWFIDDQDTVDIYIFGCSEVRDLCQRWFK
jgi:hypothetical protein